MKKRICLLFLTLIFCFSCAACTSPSENKVKLENLVFVPEELSQNKEKVIPEQTVSFRIWTTSLATASDITEMLDQIEGTIRVSRSICYGVILNMSRENILFPLLMN